MWVPAQRGLLSPPALLPRSDGMFFSRAEDRVIEGENLCSASCSFLLFFLVRLWYVPHGPLARPPCPPAAIERRLAEWTLTPVWNGEGLQVLRYKKSQKYDAVSSLVR